MGENIIITFFIIILTVKLLSLIIKKLKSEIQKEEEKQIDSDDKVIISSVQGLYKIKQDNVNSNNYSFPSTKEITFPLSDKYKEAIDNMDIIGKLKIYIGSNNDNLIYDCITELPNLLITGTIMSGKTSYVNTILCTLLLKENPNDLKIIIYDSKKIDYIMYKNIPHLYCPIITDEKNLKMCLEMIYYEKEKRYELLNCHNFKNISDYNISCSENDKISNIVVIIDELSNIYTKNNLKELFEKITSDGWNVGIYFIVVTNCYSSSLMSEMIKSNFSSRITFRTSTSGESEKIINISGAEKLLLYGNTLYLSNHLENAIKIKTPFIDERDVLKIIKYIQNNNIIANFKNDNTDVELKNEIDQCKEDYYDPIYNEVVDFAVRNGKVSVSLLQRKFRLGFNRSARMIDILEEKGIVGPQNGSKPRDVLVKIENDEEMES